MNAPTLILMAFLAAPSGSGTSPRFELRSQVTPMPELDGGRFSLRSQLQPAPESVPQNQLGRFGLKAGPVVSGAICADPLFKDGFEN